MNQLKEAERKASQLVQDARKARVERMKEAKIEADQIIAAYRAEMEAVYQKSLATQTGSSGAAGNELQMSTDSDIRNMGRDFNSNKEAVQKMLIDLVCAVNIKAEKARGAA
mmetsp:Transcript_38042/g.82861  ORF Transcript_38042/g.82861 Transcript_38042/m.82861 type:complete len:111 (+) Transcript_38042:30-362(+)|eukprot:CAMPEP_0116946772 /NCGR_PEP_ID=MMETSP0467-20121206/37214_1 /TAXON_ID=283647 /ORGANISM="Mesodinium pulex, Strain SPMC105" /LENGTH=110 /DNA_ID=CAMNT_0004630673 /DNA_START=27 /DNA_END=359 /DNA_ORIENTATION=-